MGLRRPGEGDRRGARDDQAGAETVRERAELGSRGPGVNGHQRKAGRATRQPQSEQFRTVAGGIHHEVAPLETERGEPRRLPARGIPEIACGQGRTRQRQIYERPLRRVAVHTRETFDDLAWLPRAHPAGESFTTARRASPTEPARRRSSFSETIRTAGRPSASWRSSSARGW